MAFDEDVRLEPARWPLNGFALVLAVDAPTHSATGPGLHVEPELAKALSRDRDLWASGFWGEDWAQELTRIIRVDVSASMINLLPLAAPYPPKRDARFFVLNTIAGLEQSGRFVVDAADRSLLVSSSRQDTPIIDIAVVSLLLHVKNAHDIEFRNISFERSRGDGVYVENSSRITLSNCFVADVGTRGIVVSGGDNNSISRTVVARSGETGVEMRGGDRSQLIPAHHQLVESVVTDVARDVRGRRYGVLIDGVGQSVQKSLIADLPDQAIWFMGNDHHIDQNIFLNVCYETLDSGAINSGRDLTARGTYISRNYFGGIRAFRPDAPLGNWSIYLDDYVSGITIEQNIFSNVDGGVFINGGRDNAVYNNIFLGIAKKAVLVQNLQGTPYTQKAFQPDALLMQRLHAVPFKSPIYQERYPNLAKLFEDEPQLPKYNEVRGNYIDRDSVAHFTRRANVWVKNSEEHVLPLRAWSKNAEIDRIIESSQLASLHDTKFEIRSTVLSGFQGLLFWPRVESKLLPTLGAHN
ncbi:right-handed parallel beta-helix repeat-containing protein [Bradyrhizobium sp. 173]|uniref:right-handed parallel beta-helix repeat-containing protein n=1 Tax=Bradyrhizobium sp. 173 TaxID=2782644 RepID=UPI001FF73174|nr:right-handed parallel beta-helix repeat-containing protein [Bradyrhizobium sp. 173]MCK1564119.1 right-handed parallel beta-helix repeat-containing protein [Bradyrhizobium sp. 173]